MFFIFSKLLYFFITPTFWVLALLITAIFLKKTKTHKRFLFSGIIVFIFFTNNFIVNLFVKQWEIPAINEKNITEKYENGVVLGGMVSFNPKNKKINLNPGIDRLMQAIFLYKKGIIKKIVISGGSGLVLYQDYKEADYLKNFCLQLGIPQHDIIIEVNSRNTHENALFTKKLIGTENKIVLFTSAFHMRRAAACFKHEGFNIIEFPTDPLVEPFLGPDDYFVPKSEPLPKWDFLIKEYIGYITYKIAGYL